MDGATADHARPVPRLFADDRAVAFAAWAALSAEAETRLQKPNPRLAPVDWKSGDRLWLVNLFAPFGHGEAASRSCARRR
jgi:cytolysin-activating lysine-acyltransferase